MTLSGGDNWAYSGVYSLDCEAKKIVEVQRWDKSYHTDLLNAIGVCREDANKKGYKNVWIMLSACRKVKSWNKQDLLVVNDLINYFDESGKPKPF